MNMVVDLFVTFSVAHAKDTPGRSIAVGLARKSYRVIRYVLPCCGSKGSDKRISSHNVILITVRKVAGMTEHDSFSSRSDVHRGQRKSAGIVEAVHVFKRLSYRLSFSGPIGKGHLEAELRGQTNWLHLNIYSRCHRYRI